MKVDKMFERYVTAVEPFIGFFKDSIAASPDGTIRVKVTEIVKRMDLIGEDADSIYWGIKYTLFEKGVIVTTGMTKSGEPLLIMRKKKKGDLLPEYIKYLPLKE